jgi:hypothetical protein
VELIQILFTIIGLLTGFGISQAIFVVRIFSRVDVNAANIESLNKQWESTNGYLIKIMEQNNKLIL